MLDDDDVILLTVPGWGDSGDKHWQSLWELTYPLARRVRQEDWLYPDKAVWVVALRRAIEETDAAIVIAAHSLGCHTAVACLRQLDLPSQRRIKGVLLVAPPALPITPTTALSAGELPPGAPAPAFTGFETTEAGKLPVPAVMVASRNDHFCPFAEAERMAALWGVKLVDAGEADHMGSHAGLGSWPKGQQLLQRFMLA